MIRSRVPVRLICVASLMVAVLLMVAPLGQAFPHAENENASSVFAKNIWNWAAGAFQRNRKLPKTVNPQPRKEEIWVKLHQQHVERAKKGNIGVVFYGDSITQGMSTERPLFDKYFASYQGEPFGIGGDRTQHLLWRLQNGELDGFKPKVAIVLIGTNNIALDQEEDIALGVRACVQEIHKRSSKTKILVLGILPRGQSSNDAVRGVIKRINEQLQRFANNKNVWYQDVGDKLLDKQGNITTDVMPDYLHPSAKGYQIIYEAIKSNVATLYSKH